MTKILLDACALLTFLLQEKESDKVKELLEKARQNKLKLYMSILNYGEVYIKIDQFFPFQKAQEIKDLIKNNLSIQILNLNLNIVEEAAKIKAKGRLAYPDAIALATSKANNLTLLTKDTEFKKFITDFEIQFL